MTFSARQVLTAAALNDLDITTITTSGNASIGGTLTAAGITSTSSITANGSFEATGTGAVRGDFEVGQTNATSDKFLKVLSDDGYRSEIQAYGFGQGTGVMYVGQSATYGGGVFYNGDGSPSYATGENADFVSFFRRNNGVNEVVFQYAYNSNTVSFRGPINATSTVDVGSLLTVSGRLTANGGIDGLTLANGGISGSNYNITGVNEMTINDSGEGIRFPNVTMWQNTSVSSQLDLGGSLVATGFVSALYLATQSYTATTYPACYIDRNVDATGSYSNYHYGRVNQLSRNVNGARAAVNSFWTTSSTDYAVTYGIWSGEASRFRVTNMTNSGYAYVNAAGFTVVSARYTKERIRTARDEDGDGLIDVVPASQNRAFELFQRLRPVIYDDVAKSEMGVWLGCDTHNERDECFATECESQNNVEVREHDCDLDPDCGGTGDAPCAIYLEHYNKLHLIADEVDEVYPHAVSNRADGSVVGIDHHVLATEHINVTQHLIDAVAELQSRVAELEAV